MRNKVGVLLFCGLIASFSDVAKLRANEAAPAAAAVAGSSATPPAEAGAAPLELRGIVFTESGYLFGIYYPSSRQSAWVALGQRRGDLMVQSHDVATDSIVAEFQGHIFKLAMKTSTKIENIPAVSTADALTPSQTAAVKTEVERRKKLRLESKKARLQRALAK